MSNTAAVVTIVGFAVAWIAVVGLYNAWRKPDVACRICGGKGVIMGCSPFLHRLVGGTCWWCGGNGWRMRKLSRLLGWDRNSRFTSSR